jgi:hypothetical protein
MMVVETAASAVAGVLLLLPIGSGAVLLYMGLRAKAEARAIALANLHLSALVEASPAIATIVRADGRIEMPQRMIDWLGLATAPRSLAELAGEGSGLSAEDVAELTADVTARIARDAGSCARCDPWGRRGRSRYAVRARRVRWVPPAQCCFGRSTRPTVRRRSRG